MRVVTDDRRENSNGLVVIMLSVTDHRIVIPNTIVLLDIFDKAQKRCGIPKI